jgi:hypothetical protein
MYRVEFYDIPSDRMFDPEDATPDPDETDYQHRGEGSP